MSMGPNCSLSPATTWPCVVNASPSGVGVRRELRVGELSLTAGPQVSREKQGDAAHHGDIGDVEDAGPQWSQANVEEIDDVTVRDTIGEVRRSAGEVQTNAEHGQRRPAVGEK